PLVLRRHREDRVTASRNVFAFNSQGRCGHERGGFVRPSPPHLTVGNEIAKNLPALHTRTGVIYRDRFSIGEFALRFRGRAGTLAFILLGGGSKANCEDEQNCETDLFHEHAPFSIQHSAVSIQPVQDTQWSQGGMPAHIRLSRSLKVSNSRWVCTIAEC